MSSHIPLVLRPFFSRVIFLAMIGCPLALLEGCATTQIAKEVTTKRKKKRAKKPRALEGAQLSFSGDADAARNDDDRESGVFDVTEEDSDLAAILLSEGHASFYHDSLAGRKTANGEKYDPNAKTCAHKTLPFGTVVVVEDATTGKKSTCRINDRGPFVGGRIIDLSKRVARELGIVEQGVTKVRIRVLPKAAS